MTDGITRIAAEGFKSIAKRQEIEIRPLTILAGANSSGKSSIMQPLLMLKQTLETTFDPGPLWIAGPNVIFTSTDQYRPRGTASASTCDLTIGVTMEKAEFEVVLGEGPLGIRVIRERSFTGLSDYYLRPDMSSEEIAALLRLSGGPNLSVVRNRFFLSFKAADGVGISVAEWAEPFFRDMIHVPGLRGNRSRTYPVTAFGPSFPGTFDNYVASVILLWQREKSQRYEALIGDMDRIGLAKNVLAQKLNDAEIQVLVNRAEGSPYDVVNIADVGFGVSQTLPVLVALGVADKGRLVYLEEPEIHLHPRAQARLAGVLADAAKRGVRVVAETHSSLVLRAVQTLVAKGDLDPNLVILHWFTRNADGVTQVSSAKLDANGAFGDWPEDFGDVALQSEQEYLDAVEDRLTH
jgi:hypothetical protein